MDKIIACIDGSTFSDGVCALSAWAAERCGLGVSLLHVAAPHSEMAARGDLSGQIGLGAKTSLLKHLTEQDGDHGKLELKKGRQMLERAKETLAAQGIADPDTLHRRGLLVDTLAEMNADSGLIVMGKRGEQHHAEPHASGANIEPVARATGAPILIASTDGQQPIRRFLFAYDDSPSARKALAFIQTTPLLQGLHCHIMMAARNTSQSHTALDQAQAKLTAAGYTSQTELITNQSVAAAVAATLKDHQIDLLVTGRYGHSPLRNLLRNSTTTTLIRTSPLPMLLI